MYDLLRRYVPAALLEPLTLTVQVHALTQKLAEEDGRRERRDNRAADEGREMSDLTEDAQHPASDRRKWIDHARAPVLRTVPAKVVRIS